MGLLRAAVEAALGIDTGQVEYTYEAKGFSLRLVDCEECEHHFGYIMRASATGSDFGTENVEAAAVDTSMRRARSAVSKKLKNAVDFVPCPRCGWVQDHMIPVAKKRHRRWMLATGVVLLFVLTPLGIVGNWILHNLDYRYRQPTPVLVAAAVAVGVMALLGAVLIGMKWVLSLNYDPNSEDIDWLKARGRRRVVPRKKLDRVKETFSESDRLVD